MKYGVKGFESLDKDLVSLDVKTGLKFMRKAGKKAMKSTQTLMKAGANVSNGIGGLDAGLVHMRDDIKITTKAGSRRSKSRVLVIEVGPTKKHSQKAIAQEFGTAKQKAEPFIRRAGIQSKGLQIRIIQAELKKDLNSVNRKRS